MNNTRQQIIDAYTQYALAHPKMELRIAKELEWVSNQSDDVINGFAFLLSPANKYDIITPSKIVIGMRCLDHTQDGYPI